MAASSSRKIRVSATTAAKVRKLAGQKDLTATGSIAGVIGAWVPNDFNIRQEALGHAARLPGPGDAASVVKAATQFYAFLTGGK